MSKKRKGRSGGIPQPQWDMTMGNETDKAKRMKPMARNLMLLAAVLLALGQMLLTAGVLTEPVVNLMAVVALVCAIAAAGIQFNRFGKK